MSTFAAANTATSHSHRPVCHVHGHEEVGTCPPGIYFALMLQAAQRAPSDPVLVRLIGSCGGTPPEARLASWGRWPALVALAWWCPVWASAAYLPEQDALAGCMDCMALCVPNLALAVAEAAASVTSPDDAQVSDINCRAAQAAHLCLSRGLRTCTGVHVRHSACCGSQFPNFFVNRGRSFLLSVFATVPLHEALEYC